MRRSIGAVLLIAASLLAACGGGPEDELDRVLREVGTQHDAYFEEHDRYPAPLTMAEDLGLSEASLEEWNIDVNYGDDYGYCIEGADEGGTWHLSRGDSEPSGGDCPES